MTALERRWLTLYTLLAALAVAGASALRRAFTQRFSEARGLRRAVQP